jgi:sugar (pentulose or hexulose) kinase
MSLGISQANTDNLRDFKSKCTPEMLELEANREAISKMERAIKRNDCTGNLTVYLGNILGLASGAVFCVGCYFVRQSIVF